MRDFDDIRVPPNDTLAEQAVLGALMLAPEAWELVQDMLEPSDFYRRDHHLIFQSVKELAEKGRPRDAVTMGEWFQAQGLSEMVGGGAYLVELATTTPSAANVVAYAEIVRDKAVLRKLIEAGTDMVAAGFNPDGRDAGEIVNEVQASLVDLQPRQSGGLRQSSDSLADWYDRFSAKADEGAHITGLATPWSELNDVTHGLQPATLYLIAARPSMGKSVFGLNLALMTAMRNHTAAVFSLEMSNDDCNNRNVASLGGVSHEWVSSPDRDFDKRQQVNEALRKIMGAPLFIDDTPSLTTRQFVARARRMNRKRKIELLVIDHIHDFKIDVKLARFEYGLVCQAAKDLGKEWNIPVVALAQLNRNVGGRIEKRPTLVDLRESGELEQKADVIIFLHREDYYDTPSEKTHLQDVVEAHIAKGRNIRSGSRIYLRNRYDQMRLEDWNGPLPKPPAQPVKAPRKSGYVGKNAAAGDD